MTREKLIEDVCSGKRSIWEAELLAKKHGIDPIEIDYPFDPRRKAHWTLAEALIWIKHRNYDAVKRANKTWRSKASFFRTTCNPSRPYEYGSADKLLYLELLRVIGHDYQNIFAQLREKVEEGVIATYGSERINGNRKFISPEQWIDVELAVHVKSGLPVIRHRDDPLSWVNNNGHDVIYVRSDLLQQTYFASDEPPPLRQLSRSDVCNKIEEIKARTGDLPTLDQVYHEINAIDPRWTRDKIKPLFKIYAGNREKGRPKKRLI
jgi:hypothetical protein